MANKNDITEYLKSILGDTVSELKEVSALLKETSEITADSWEDAFNRLSNTWTDTVGEIAKSNDVTTIIGGLNDLLSVVSNVIEILDFIKTINPDSSLFAGIKNVGSLKMFRLKTSVLCCEICRQQ